MNYIYDILVNFNSEAYDFFEWNSSDNILHIRKIPVIKVESTILSDIENYNISLESSFLEHIKRKTEVFNNKSIRLIEYACLLSDGTTVLAIMMKNNQCLKSKLLLDEEEEVLAIAQKLREETVAYKKLKKQEKNVYKTRKQLENEQKLKKALKKLFNEKNQETLKYMYYECFNKKEENLNVIRKDLQYILEENNEVAVGKIKNILKLLEIKH